MKCIRVKQPWAWLIFHSKDVENRDWRTSHRGPLLIHASQNYDRSAEAWVAGMFPTIRIPQDLPKGAILGRVEVTDCVMESDSPWFTGPYGLILRNPMEFRKPIAQRGMPGIFAKCLTTW